MFRQLRSQKGLTLVELMVVVAIIAIIAAVAITVFQDIQKKAKLAADQGNVAAMRSAVAIYYGKNNGIFPADEACRVVPGDAGPDVAVRHDRRPTPRATARSTSPRPSTTARKRCSSASGGGRPE